MNKVRRIHKGVEEWEEQKKNEEERKEQKNEDKKESKNESKKEGIKAVREDFDNKVELIDQIAQIKAK